ncbi:MAG: hypothetical protein WDZ49_00665, partial [Litorilinea sp.]
MQPLFAPETFTRLDYSPLVQQWQFLRPEHLHIFWMTSLDTWGWNMWLLFAFLLLLLISGMALLYQLITAPVADSHLADSHPARVSLWETATRPYVLGVLIAAVLVLTTVYQTAGTTVQRQLAQRIQDAASAEDAILHLVPTSTQQFANAYHGDLPVYGLRDAGELDGEQAAWLTRLSTQYRRLWIVHDFPSADQSAWERALRGEDFLLYESRPAGADTPRISLFALAPGQTLQEAGLGTIFGDPVATDGIDAQNGWIRLSGYGLTPNTHPGGELLLALRWESLQPVTENYHVFVHLLDQDGDRLAQRDGQPVQWLRPTTTWQPGEEIIDRYGLLLSEDTPPGEYTVAVGLYHPVTGQRLPISAGP